jgi:hypothetical protein
MRTGTSGTSADADALGGYLLKSWRRAEMARCLLGLLECARAATAAGESKPAAPRAVIASRRRSNPDCRRRIWIASSLALLAMTGGTRRPRDWHCEYRAVISRANAPPARVLVLRAPGRALGSRFSFSLRKGMERRETPQGCEPCRGPILGLRSPGPGRSRAPAQTGVRILSRGASPVIQSGCEPGWHLRAPPGAPSRRRCRAPHPARTAGFF